jgi:hypothetical protein
MMHFSSSNLDLIGFEVLTSVIMKSTIFWDITPYSPLKINRSLGETYYLHLQGQRIRQTRNELESRWQSDPCLLTCSGLHGIISQKVGLSNFDLELSFRRNFLSCSFRAFVKWETVAECGLSL